MAVKQKGKGKGKGKPKGKPASGPKGNRASGKGGGKASPRDARRKQEGLPRNLRDIYSAILLVLGVLMAISIYWDFAGPVGRFLSDASALAMGQLRYVIPPVLILGAVVVFAGLAGYGGEDRKQLLRVGPVEVIGGFIFFLGLCAVFHVGYGVEEMFVKENLKAGGGVFGACIAWPLVKLLSETGAIVIICGMIVIGFLMLTGLTISNSFQARVERRKERLKQKRLAREQAKLQAEAERQRLAREPAPVAADLKKEVEIEGVPEAAPAPPEIVIAADAAPGKPDAAEVQAGPDDLAAQDKQMILALKESSKAGKRYSLPPLNLLRKTDPGSSMSKKSINESIAVVEKTMHDFDVDAAVTRVTRGPTVTRFEVELGSGVKVNQVRKLEDDIAYAMASPDIRIIAPIPGKSAIGIEVPNQERDMVTLGDILSQPAVQSDRTPLRAVLGKDVAGQPVVVNLAEMPHLLLAGSTGSGKSCCINTLITSILYSATPDQVRLIMIDPKFVELSHFNGIPHLLTAVVTDPKRASGALGWVVREMELRYKLLSRAGMKNIDSYNQEVENGLKSEVDEDGKPIFNAIPYILVVIDELADLMMVAPAEVEESIARIAQMARAVGIHLVVATQRPSVDVVTGMIKANIPSRVAFTVASQTDSRVILDTPGAEKLVGRGDMLFLAAGTSKPQRVQGAYISEKEIEPVVAFIKRQRTSEYNSEIIEDSRQDAAGAGKTDELLDEAMEVVVKTGQASASFLQRRLSVGYARAARLIDLLEDRGIVGGHDGSKPRAVLITPEEFEKMKEKEEGGG
jgi:DNA segregation ATPase FtsK/SpoIIIE, S-DNA-T family